MTEAATKRIGGDDRVVGVPDSATPAAIGYSLGETTALFATLGCIKRLQQLAGATPVAAAERLGRLAEDRVGARLVHQRAARGPRGSNRSPK